MVVVSLRGVNVLIKIRRIEYRVDIIRINTITPLSVGGYHPSGKYLLEVTDTSRGDKIKPPSIPCVLLVYSRGTDSGRLVSLSLAFTAITLCIEE